MSFERLVNRVIGRRKKESNMNSDGYDSAYQPSNAPYNNYAYPEQNPDLPGFIKSEIEEKNADLQAEYERNFKKKKKKSFWSWKKKEKPVKNTRPEPPRYQSSYTHQQQPEEPKKKKKRNFLLQWFIDYLRPPKRHRGPKPIRSWQYRIGTFFVYWSFIGAIWGLLCLVIAVTVYALLSPDPLKAGLKNKPAYVSILASNGKVIAEKGLRRNHVKLEEMPKHVVNAVLATEDRRFYYHPGLDPIGITRAMIQNRRAGRIVQGGSTITQQLAKVLFLKPARNYWRKIEEMLLSFWLEYRFSKKQILELYLNRIYFGAGNYGIEAAAQHYFGKNIENVTVHEAAMLAGLIKSPTYYAPTTNFERSIKRGQVVMKLMYDSWLLSFKDYNKAKENPPVLRSYLPSESYGYVIDFVIERVSAYGQNLQADMVVQTTIDYDLQGTAQRIVRDNMAQHGEKYRASQGAAVILDRNGAIKAMVGGRDYRKSPFNRVAKAKRQPGSTFKPFVFLAAMERGMKPDSMVHDGPLRIGDWSPKNYNNRYYGDVTLREGLARSLNTISVRLAEWAGRDQVIKTAHRLGINTKLQNNPSIALGTSEVSLLELSGAYVPFSNGGYAVQPHVIKKITDKKGTVLYSNKTKNWGRVMRPRFVSAMNDMLTAVVLDGTAKNAQIDPHQSAGKTGTGQGYKDAWFVGYTGHYTGGVWIGNDDNKPMKESTGGALPAMIWRDIMQYAHLEKQPVKLPGGNWKTQGGEWASEERRPGRKRGFWESLFGGGGSSDRDTTLGTGTYEDRGSRRRGRSRHRDDSFDEIFGNDF